MNSRKKLIISLSALAFVVVAAVVAVVAVLAATQQTINSAVKVSYTAKDVACTIQASALPQNGSTETLAPVVFQYNTPVETKNANFTDVEFGVNAQGENKDTWYVEYTYVFTNNGSAAFDAVLSVNVTDGEDEYVVSVKVNTGDYEVSNTATAEVAGGVGSTATVVVKVELPEAKRAVDAEFAASFNWVLTSEYHVAG